MTLGSGMSPRTWREEKDPRQAPGSAAPVQGPARPCPLEWCALAELLSLAALPKPPNFLDAQEAERYAALKFPKRRLDWLAARLAAKRLVRALLAGRGVELRLESIGIRQRFSGSPYALAPEPLGLAPIPLSLSHSGGWAVCAASEDGAPIGVDIEAEASAPDASWLDIAFHPQERSPRLEQDPRAQLELWTRKEAVLKMLGVGLSADLWHVRFCPSPEGEILELEGVAREAWEALGRPAVAWESLHDAGRGLVMSLARPAAPPAAERRS